MTVGRTYKLMDIYTVKIEGRLAVVGGVVDEGSGSCTPVYVWMPTSLVRNFTEEIVRSVAKSMAGGRVARFVYKGMKPGKGGMEYYDAEWVKNA